MAVKKTYQGKKYKLSLVEYPKTRRYEIHGFDNEDGVWICNTKTKLRTYDYYAANEQFMSEVRELERDGVEFSEVYLGGHNWL